MRKSKLHVTEKEEKNSKSLHLFLYPSNSTRISSQKISGTKCTPQHSFYLKPNLKNLINSEYQKNWSFKLILCTKKNETIKKNMFYMS